MSSFKGSSPENLIDLNSKMLRASFNIARSKTLFWTGLLQYTSSFMVPYWSVLNYFSSVELSEKTGKSPLDTVQDLLELLFFEIQIAAKGTMAGVSAMNRYHTRELEETIKALGNSLMKSNAEDIIGYSERKLRAMETLVKDYPRAIRDVSSEFGLHFKNGGYVKIAETDRFELYQVLPTARNVEVRQNGKPMIIVPPYVLGANILAFLPGEDRSYVHAFANEGMPTYIRVVKDIAATPAVQVMSGEDDARDTRFFSEMLLARHGKKVTLNGYCQGGFMSVVDILSGELDGLVDALITCVAPMDGSRSKSLVEYIEHLPYRFRNLGYALKRMPNGNRVVDGKVMSWVFKLKSIEQEGPLSSFYRDLSMFDGGSDRRPKISKVAAAISHWLTYDVTDIPERITRLSFDSYTKPVAKDGTLPVRVFGRPLNFRQIQEKGIKWLICIAENDDLVDPGAALAPLDFIDAEVAVFPKGHAAIATSWSSPASACHLEMKNTKDCPLTGSKIDLKHPRGRARGPLRFQLDLEKAADNDALPPYDIGTGAMK